MESVDKDLRTWNLSIGVKIPGLDAMESFGSHIISPIRWMDHHPDSTGMVSGRGFHLPSPTPKFSTHHCCWPQILFYHI